MISELTAENHYLLSTPESKLISDLSDQLTSPPSQPGLTQCQTAIVGGSLARFEQRDSGRFEAGPQGRHQHSVHRTATANGQPPARQATGHSQRPVGQAGGQRGMEESRTVRRIVTAIQQGGQ